MPTYRKAEPAVVEFVNDVMRKYHAEIVEAGVTIQVLFAHARRDKHGVPKGAALKHHGVQAAAIIKITSSKDRASGMADARLYLDGDRWFDDWDAEEQESLIDHEGQHLELVKDEDENIELDDNDRPRLKCREHDADIGVFYSVIQRHGRKAFDWQVVDKVRVAVRQLEFAWGRDTDVGGGEDEEDGVIAGVIDAELVG